MGSLPTLNRLRSTPSSSIIPSSAESIFALCPTAVALGGIGGKLLNAAVANSCNGGASGNVHSLLFCWR